MRAHVIDVIADKGILAMLSLVDGHKQNRNLLRAAGTREVLDNVINRLITFSYQITSSDCEEQLTRNLHSRKLLMDRSNDFQHHHVTDGHLKSFFFNIIILHDNKYKQ